jgi:hypothetical protein
MEVNAMAALTSPVTGTWLWIASNDLHYKTAKTSLGKMNAGNSSLLKINHAPETNLVVMSSKH